jgi:hypothetical protein
MFQSCEINLDHSHKKRKLHNMDGLTEHAVEKHFSKSTATTK